MPTMELRTPKHKEPLVLWYGKRGELLVLEDPCHPDRGLKSDEIDGAELPESLEYQFASTTTCHGLARIAESERKPRRLFWILVVTIAFSMAAWQISLRFVDYFSFPTNTDISRVYEMEKKFPAVSICNYNQFLKSKLTDSDLKILDISKDLYRTYDIFSGNLEDSPRYRKLSKQYHDKMDAGRFLEEKGWKLKGGWTMIKCTFRGKPCDLSSWTHRFTSFGNCYTFNGNAGQTLTQLLPGSSNGLTVEIDTLSGDSSEAIENHQETGSRFLIHPEYEPPYVVWEGLSVSPGTHANAGIREKYHTNLQAPWGECDQSMKVGYSDKYTRSACTMECKRFYVEEECHCKPVYYPGDSANCSLLQMACARKVIESINENFNWYCNCPVPCNYHEYDVQLSYSKLTGTRVRQDGAKEKLNETYVSNNIVGIGVYYEDLSFEHIQQQASVDAGAFLSDLGGQMGLFVGMSLLTMLEFVEYFMARTYMSFKGFTRGRKAPEE